MEHGKKLAALMQQKRDQFTAYEQATQQLLAADMDSAEKYITHRGEIATSIDQIQREFDALLAGQPDEALLREVAAARINYAQVPPAYADLYQTAQEVRSIVARVIELDKQAMDRLKSFQADALAVIKENKTLPQIKRYLTDLGTGQEAGSLRNGKA